MVTMNNSALDEPVSAILIHHKDQVETPVEYVATPMLDTKGNLTGNVIIIHDESAQRSLNRQLIFQASCDALTGLPNRYEFERKLKQLVAAVSDESGMHTLCYLDIDEFRLINDTYGHSAGDELLKQFAALLNNIVHEKHILARIGKDKFGLLLENCDITQSRPVINNIFNAIDQYNFIWDTSSSRINVSIGITTFTAGNASCEQLLSNVNSACLLAKEDGRDRLQIYTSEDNNLLTQQREMHWVSRINHALEEDRFQLYYHEILPLQENSKRFMRHGEVLLRMVNKQGELVSPNMFLPAARRYGMLGVIDEWVVQKTIEWLSEGNKKVAISMNISGYSISSNSFLNFVVTSLIQSKINPELLCFEITESVAIKHLSAAIHFMTVLKNWVVNSHWMISAVVYHHSHTSPACRLITLKSTAHLSLISTKTLCITPWLNLLTR